MQARFRKTSNNSNSNTSNSNNKNDTNNSNNTSGNNKNGRFRECVGASLASKLAQRAFVTEVGPVFTSVAPHRNLACQDFGPHSPIIFVTIILITIIGIIVIVTITIIITVTIITNLARKKASSAAHLWIGSPLICQT